MAWAKKLPYEFIIIGILIIIIYFLYYKSSEGFSSQTLYDKANDRANPLAASQNPVTGPIPIGISEADADYLKKMNQIALNIPTATANGQGTFTQTTPKDLISPRMDNENSFLGMVKFCKDYGAAHNDRPFDDPQFNENCGMCVTSGTLIDKTSFDTNSGPPVGVLVYQNDKKQFWKEKDDNSYAYTRAIPSLNSAVCAGATTGAPALAITQEDYDKFRKRSACIHSTGGQASSCGTCLTNNAKSWIDMGGGFKTITMLLWGSGNATVSIGGNQKGSQQTLSMTKESAFPLGLVPEDTPVQIEVASSSSTQGQGEGQGEVQSISLYGAIYAETPSGGEYRLAIDDFLEIDAATGSFPRTGLPKSFKVSKGDVSCVQLKPQPSKTKLTVTGTFPLTFVDSDQLASYDCPVGPYIMNDANAGLFGTTDPCLNPKGQSIDNYSDGCLRTTLTTAGCSTDGEWYGDLDVFRADYKGKSTAEMKTGIGATSRRDKAFMMKCFADDLSTPCDPYLASSSSASVGAGGTAGGIPNQACMSYLYTNQSAASDFVGAAYSGTPYISNPTGTQLPFCQSAGSLNPASAAGLAQLQSAAQSYNGATGISAVKSYLTDVFAKATSDKPQNIPDAKGGRYDSWGACIGTAVQAAAVPGALNVTATPGNALADISWTTPDTGGATITGYVVTYTPLESAGAVTSTGTNTSRITGLRNGITYTVNVVANNIMGGSTPGSATVQPVQPVCATAGQDIEFATSQCSSTGMWQKYVWGSDSNGNCIQQTSGAPTCNSNCPGALLQGGCGYVPCSNAGQLVPANNSNCDTTGKRQNYVYNSGSNGACIQDISGSPWCDPTCPGALLQGGCGYVPCSTAGQLVPANNSNCDTNGKRQNYVYNSGSNGACIQDISGSPWCDPTCPGALLQGGCGYVPCSTAGQTGAEYTLTGMKQEYTWVSGPNGECVKYFNKGPAACDSTNAAATAVGGCAYVAATGGPAGTRNWTSVASSSDGVKLVAVVDGGQIYTSTDSGAIWTPRESNRNWRSVASSSDGVKLVAVVLSGQIYTSTDSGASWTPRDTNRYWRSVASSSNGDKLVAVAYAGQIYTSTDSGSNWLPRESSRTWRSVASSSDGLKLVAGVYGGQIYTSTDSGSNWLPRDSNRLWSSVASSSNGDKLVAVADFGQIYTSTDSGSNWLPRDSNRNWYSVASSSNGDKLVALVLNGRIYTSTDSGASWTPRESNRNWYSVASSSNGDKLVAVELGGQIYTSTDSGVTWYPSGSTPVTTCSNAGQTGADYSSTGIRQNYTWASGANGACVKNNNGAAFCDSTNVNALAFGGCAYCLTNAASKPTCPGYVAPYVAPVNTPPNPVTNATFTITGGTYRNWGYKQVYENATFTISYTLPTYFGLENGVPATGWSGSVSLNRSPDGMNNTWWGMGGPITQFNGNAESGSYTATILISSHGMNSTPVTVTASRW